MDKGVFLDRDGVLNDLILNPDTNEYEPPHRVEDVHLFPYTIGCLRELQSAGYVLFMVSNQPDYAKGKVSLRILDAIHEKFVSFFSENNIDFRQYYYCFHHPDGIVPEYSVVCDCRKPKPYFLLQAAEDYSVDLAKSWMIGDRDSDILCGQAAGVRTILVENPYSIKNRGNSSPDFIVKNLFEATKIILIHSN